MAEKKLSYKEVPQALKFSISTLWNISPSYVSVSFFQEIFSRAVGFVGPLVLAAVTTRLPYVASSAVVRRQIIVLISIGFMVPVFERLVRSALSWWEAKTEFTVMSQLRENFYMAYARIDFALYENKDVVDSYNTAETFLMRMLNFGTRRLASMFGALLTFVGAAFALLTVHWSILALYLIILPFSLVAGHSYNKKLVKTRRANQTVRRQIWVIEGLFYPRFIKEVRIYGLAAALLKRREKLAKKENDDERVLTKQLDRLGLATFSMSSVAELVASILAIFRIAYHAAPLGVFVLAQQFTSRATAAIDEFFSSLRDFDEDLYGFAEYRHITETLQPHTQGLRDEMPTDMTLSMHNLDFAYPETQKKVIHNLNLTIPYGQHIAIVGENGAGKSTIINVLLGLYAPQVGDVAFGGIPVLTLHEARRLRLFGILPQEFNITFDITVRDMIWFGDVKRNRSDDAAIWEVLEMVEMADQVRTLPKQLDTYIGTWVEDANGVEFSGGQQQRLAIARALYRNAPIMILDEPTSAIDALAEKRIFERLMKQREGKTTIFVSHRFSTVRRAQMIAVIDKGRLVELGTHEELRAKQGQYERMYSVQAEGFK